MSKLKLPPVLNRSDFDSNEEFEMYQSTEAGEWVSSGNVEEAREKWQLSARETISGKRERITIAIPERTLSRIRSKALRQGIPYQTLINKTLHDLVKR